MNDLTLRPMTGGCGAEVLGVDLANLSNSDWQGVRDAFADFGVIFFRDQTLTPEQHIAFANRWGTIDINKFFRADATHPEIAEVRKEPDQQLNIGGGWHTDHSYDQVPAMGSILVARELPEFGGDTLYANLYAAYDALSDGLKETLNTLRAVHSSRHVFGNQGAYKGTELDRAFGNEHLVDDVVHPAVITHPLSGRKAAARVPVPPRGAAGVHLPVPLGTRLGRAMGQPLHLALCAERLPRPAAADASDYGGGGAAALRGGHNG